jgi:uncharacterized membrane protein YfcA
MVALVWVAAALAVLYFWLAGHWFARVLAFLGFVVVLGLVGGEVMTHAGGELPIVVFGVCVGAGLAWFIASLPTYYWRAKIRAFEAEQRADEARRAAERQVREDAEQPQQAVGRRGGYDLQQIALIKRAEEGR